MKQIFLLLFCFLPLVVTAQIKDFSDEEINKDKNYIALQSEIKPVEDKLEAIMKEYKQAAPEKKNDQTYQKTMEKRYSDVMDELASVLQSFISKNPDSYISLLALGELMSFNSGIDQPGFVKLYKGLSDDVRKTGLGEELESVLFAAERTVIGAVAPDFTQNDPAGEPVKLSDFRGKYVLIDFWASWCRPCRMENPNIVRAYAQFKDKNFEILGVSLDNPNAKTAWLNAIERDKLTWAQVSDLQGWKNKVARLYGVESIPLNFLIDPEGVIIAKNLRGEELFLTLSKILN